MDSNPSSTFFSFSLFSLPGLFLALFCTLGAWSLFSVPPALPWPLTSSWLWPMGWDADRRLERIGEKGDQDFLPCWTVIWAWLGFSTYGCLSHVHSSRLVSAASISSLVPLGLEVITTFCWVVLVSIIILAPLILPSPLLNILFPLWICSPLWLIITVTLCKLLNCFVPPFSYL